MIQISDGEFQRLVSFVRERYGINLEHKRELVVSRLSLELSRLGYTSYSRYLDQVISSPEGTQGQQMIDRLSTNHTYFFRDEHSLRHLTATAVPELLSRGCRHISIWCAAASSGQECYSIAMELDSCLSLSGPELSFSILGTDINKHVLDQARSGIYDNKELENIPSRFRRRYTRDQGDGSFAIAPQLRRRVQWQQKNLMQPFDFPRPQDLIFCRNVMIYFRPETRRQLVARLHQALQPGGYLYVGATESIDMERRYFRYIAPTVYRKGG